ncbi:MAG: signal peptidase I [Ruminococcaceae bacterium]|nr:signal peptidase I [Oscillospiraceae bacterium]
MLRKLLGKAGSVLSTLLVAVEILVILFIVVSKMSGDAPSLFGYRMYVIISPSMEPEIEVGDIIISKDYKGGELAVGDVVTYLGTKGDVAGKMITHKIVSINGDSIVTKGTANLTADPAIDREEIISVMKYQPAALGAVYGVLTSTAGFICLVLLPLGLMIVSEVVNLVLEIRKEGEEDDKDASEE